MEIKEEVKNQTQLIQDSENSQDETAVIPVIEEQIVIDKKVVESGKVKVSKKVREEEVTVDVPALHEEVEVEKISVNRYVDQAPPSVRYEGDTMIISVVEEVTVVEKRLVVVEELHIRKKQIETKIPHKVTLRKEEVIINRDSPESETSL